MKRKLSLSPSRNTSHIAKKKYIHPIFKFKTKAKIEKGKKFSDSINTELVSLIGESLSDFHVDFNLKKFIEKASFKLSEMAWKQRTVSIGQAMRRYLPEDDAESLDVLIASFGPAVGALEYEASLNEFFYAPHSMMVRDIACLDVFDKGIEANYELTKRYTAEFSIRPYYELDPERCLVYLREWATDENYRVRRLVSEGIRPRLPWAGRLKSLQVDPMPAVGLLEMLKDDEELYVRRSVANHIGDIAKDHLDLALDLCERWLEELDTDRYTNEQIKNRKWLIRHALRYPSNKLKNERALNIRTRAK